MILSKMLTAVLLDDEPKALKSLEWEIENFCSGITIEASFNKPYEALEYLRKNEVDCLFLDIQMPEMDGFEFLEHFKGREFLVVFTTAYDEYALKAIKENAFDYLLKPLDSDDLVETVEKLKTKKKEQHSYKTIEEDFLTNSKQQIVIPVDGKLLFFTADEVIYCASDGNYTRVFLTEQRKLYVSKNLKEMEHILPDKTFFRIHNSYVVNLKKVKAYLKKDAFVVLEGGAEIPVSRSKKQEFLEKYKFYGV